MVFLPELGKSATITRKVSSPKKVKIGRASDDVKAVPAEIADHPEIALSRREILRFIQIEPTKRSTAAGVIDISNLWNGE